MMREVFERWGLPERIRVDNGHPWGSANDLPPALALWWIGLGIGVTWNPRRRPQKNGKVERTNGVIQGWVEAWTCTDAGQLPGRLSWAERVQREEYPAIKGRSRLEAYPGLRVIERPYQREREGQLWDEARVYAYLAQGVWRRRADRVGQVSLYNRGYIVGRRYAGQEVLVRLDPGPVEWVMTDLQGVELRRHRAEQLARERLLGMAVSHRKPSQQKSAAVQADDGVKPSVASGAKPSGA
jgi:hypothetical protein